MQAVFESRFQYLERLEKGKRLNKDITGLNLDGSGRPHLDVHPLPASSTTDDGKGRALLSCNKFEDH